MINVLLVMGIIIPVLVIVILLLISVLKKQKVEIKKLNNDVKEQQDNLIYLYHHAEEIADIKKARNHFEDEIKGAKTDEEVVDIINAIISTNNVRVRNNQS